MHPPRGEQKSVLCGFCLLFQIFLGNLRKIFVSSRDDDFVKVRVFYGIDELARSFLNPNSVLKSAEKMKT